MGMDKMCNDHNSMEFIDAVMKHVPPPDKVGISYMLAGDDGASNTDPYAMGKTADMHVKPLFPARRWRRLPSFSTRTTAAPFATASGAAERAWVMYSESDVCFC